MFVELYNVPVISGHAEGEARESFKNLAGVRTGGWISIGGSTRWMRTHTTVASSNTSQRRYIGGKKRQHHSTERLDVLPTTDLRPACYLPYRPPRSQHAATGLVLGENPALVSSTLAVYKRPILYMYFHYNGRVTVLRLILAHSRHSAKAEKQIRDDRL